MEAQMNLVRVRRTARIGDGESLAAPVGRYLFGPRTPPALTGDALLAEIDRLGGLVVPADIMRVTGLGRAESEALLCKLAARHGGDVGAVGTAVMYRFPTLVPHAPRLLANRSIPPAIWDRPRSPVALTGNDPSLDFVLLLTNLLAVAASALWVMLTVWAAPWIPSLGVLVLSLSLFALALPVARALNRGSQIARLAAENGRRGVVRAVLQRRPGAALSAHALSHAWVSAAGRAVTSRRLMDEVQALGGEPDVDAEARLHFRFPDLDHEARALNDLRRAGITAA
jgi:hypothetical protein